MSRTPHRRPSRAGERALPDDGPFRTASDDGWTRAAQRHAVARGDLERVRRGVLDVPCEIDPDVPRRRLIENANLRMAQAAALCCNRAVISHAPAAIAIGIPTIGDLGRPCLTVQSGTALRDLADVHLHRATLRDDDVLELGAYRITSPARTVMDLAREHGVAAGVVAADYALHERLVGLDDLHAAFEQCRNWPGRKAARIALASVDDAAESPLESLSRLQMAAHGLPAPRSQRIICNEYGTFLGRSDFYWDEVGVVGEADGNQKYLAGTSAIIAERERHQAFENTGLIVVRWGWSDLNRFHAVARRLRMGFARGARPGSRGRRWLVRLHP